MVQLGNAIIITEDEKREILDCIDRIFKCENSLELDLKHRMPYYTPSVDDFKAHLDLDPRLLLPYYFFLTDKDADGDYRFEPDDMDLMETREFIEEYYSDKIFVVENKEKVKEMEALYKKKMKE